jgi:hypothetical protein
MKHLLLTLFLATLCATGYAQTLKSVMIDTNGVQVNQFGSGSATNPAIKLGATNWGFWRATGPDRIFVSVNGTTVATFTSNSVAATTFSGNLSGGVTIGAGQSISFGGGANVSGTRTNLGLGWPALTNSNAATSLLGINASNEVVAATNIIFTNGVAFTTNAAAATLANLGLGTNASVTISNLNVQSVNISNVTNFRTAIGLGATNDLEFNTVNGTSGLSVRQGTNFFFSAGDDVVESFVPITIYHPNGLDFAGTNAPAARVSTMRALAGSTNTNEPFSGTIQFVDGNNVDIYIYVTNGIITGWAD